MYDPGERTACGLSLDDLRDLMAARVTVWADRQHALRLEREATDAAVIAKHRAAWQADVLRHRRNGAAYRLRRKTLAGLLGDPS